MTAIDETVEMGFDKIEVPETVQLLSVTPVKIPIDAYVSQAYADAEKDLLWPKTWQIACRVEELPEVGDFVTYEIGDESIIIVRNGPEQIDAFFNVCQHRGRRLVDAECGHANQFRCAFHGWRWKTDGQCSFVNDRRGWGDKLTPENTALPSVQVDLWGGWVWVNMDAEAEPLHEYLAPAVRQLGPYELDKMRYRWRQRIIFPCNWKVALEAFNESHHAAISHPQLNKYGTTPFWHHHVEGRISWHGAAVRTGIVGRPGMTSNMVDTGTTSAATKDARVMLYHQLKLSMDDINSMTTDTFINAAKRLVDELPEGTPPADVLKHLMASAERDDLDRGVVWPKISVEHMQATGHDWHLFPNSVVLVGITYALAYRARPNGSDPNSCIFETYVIERYPEGGEPKTEWEIINDPEDTRWPLVLQQDFNNMPKVQLGMKSRGFKGARPNPRAEVGVSHFHHVLSEYMGAGKPQDL